MVLNLHYSPIVGFTQVTTGTFDLLMSWSPFTPLDIDGCLPPRPVLVTTLGVPAPWL